MTKDKKIGIRLGPAGKGKPIYTRVHEDKSKYNRRIFKQETRKTMQEDESNAESNAVKKSKSKAQIYALSEVCSTQYAILEMYDNSYKNTKKYINDILLLFSEAEKTCNAYKLKQRNIWQSEKIKQYKRRGEKSLGKSDKNKLNDLEKLLLKKQVIYERLAAEE